MDAGAVGQAGVHAVIVIVDRAAGVLGDVASGGHQQARTGELELRAVQLAVALEVDHIVPIDEDFGDRGVVQQRQHGAEEVADGLLVDFLGLHGAGSGARGTVPISLDWYCCPFE